MASANEVKAGSAYIEIKTRIGPEFFRGMARIGRILQRVSLGFVRLAKKVAIAAIAMTAAFAGATAFFVKAASDAEEVGAKFDTVFKGIVIETRKWVQDFAGKFGLANDAVERWMSGLQDTFVPLGFARRESANLSKRITQLATDMGSFNNVGTEDVIRDITSALVGNHETVRKYGVIITEQTLKDFALREGITKNVKAMTNQEKVLGRIGILFNSTADAQGDMERTMSSTANTARRLAAAWRNLRVEIGNVMKQDVTEWLNTMTDFLRVSGPSIIEGIKRAWASLVPVIEVIGTKFLELSRSGALDRLVDNIRGGIVGIRIMIRNLLSDMDRFLSKIAKTQAFFAFGKTKKQLLAAAARFELEAAVRDIGSIQMGFKAAIPTTFFKDIAAAWDKKVTKNPSLIRGFAKLGATIADGLLGRLKDAQARLAGLFGGVSPIGEAAYGGIVSTRALSGATTAQLNAPGFGRVKAAPATESTQIDIRDSLRIIASAFRADVGGMMAVAGE